MEFDYIPTQLIIDDERVVKFYIKHKNFDINKINLKLIELLENLNPCGTSDLHETEILNSMANLSNEFENLNVLNKTQKVGIK
jgi:hypothetical protein